MRPGSIGSPSFGLPAGRGPARIRTAGSTLFTPGARCQTTNTAAGRSRGRPVTTFSMAAMPPAEAPITTISRVAIATAVQASGLGFFHQQDHAVALLLVVAHQRRAGDAALDHLAAAVDGVEHHLLAVALAR